ncbi:MAG: signal recognition particle-docking protein FtsY [Deltaproteobacteria bacterium]|nr:signal recognition particle-docking protein FtsY [Deltaproteobacteria bacterium]
MAFFKKKKGKGQKSSSTTPGKEPVQTIPDSNTLNQKKGRFRRLRQGLSKTRSSLTGRLDRLFLGKKEITEELLEDLEEILFTSDIARKELKDPEKLKIALKEHMLSFLNVGAVEHPSPGPGEPLVIMVVGVNGVGKTTTIGKAASRFRSDGKEVLLVAADTFRAAAVEQLSIWGERVGATVIKQDTGSDPSAVAFDALTAAVARKVDVVLIDTAGRLHTKINLMEELQKIHRVIGGKLPGAPHEVWLVLDATTGQNAIAQAKTFNERFGVTSIILTKLDGTAKGGIVVGISGELDIPIKFIGIGEKMDDLRPFDAADFVQAIFD